MPICNLASFDSIAENRLRMVFITMFKHTIKMAPILVSGKNAKKIPIPPVRVNKFTVNFHALDIVFFLSERVSSQFDLANPTEGARSFTNKTNILRFHGPEPWI